MPDPDLPMICLRCSLNRSLHLLQNATHAVARGSWRPEALILLSALWLTLTANHAFWLAVLGERDGASIGTWLSALGIATVLSALHFLVAALTLPNRLLKAGLSLLIATAAFASFYIGKFHIVIDSSMIGNVMNTDLAEAKELITPDLFLHLALFLVFPLWLLWTARLRPEASVRQALLRRLGWSAVALAVGCGALAMSFKDLAPLMRLHKEIRYLATPENVLYGVARNLRPSRSTLISGEKQPVGPDARLGAAWQQRERPALFVVVLGETARAANWGLHAGPDGTMRQTTPELAQRPVIQFGNVSSCGTNTETSVPCLFSPQGRAHYDEDAIRNSESLLHVLARAGFRVVWRDNQAGCKGVCSGLETQTPDRRALPELCEGERCLDEALLQGMEQLLDDGRGNLVLVMHQLGNHGPAYFRRYPERFRRFAPTCDTADLSQCSREEIVNAYDNALLYTDHFLARSIDFLEAQKDRYDTALLYVSDHGESLGENGLFLHGLPYSIAPQEQTRVPMMLWLSDQFSRDFAVDRKCLAERATLPASHDNVFHSLLGLLDVATQAYKPELDLSAACRA